MGLGVSETRAYILSCAAPRYDVRGTVRAMFKPRSREVGIYSKLHPAVAKRWGRPKDVPSQAQ